MSKLQKALYVSALSLLTAAGMSLRAGTFTANFNSGLPAGSTTNGNAFVDTSGGTGGSGVLKLVRSVNSQNSSYIVEDLDAGAPVYGFDLSMKAAVGGGSATPADGWSVNFASDLPDAPFGEQGTGSGLTVVFDTFVNADLGETAPTVRIKFGGATLSTMTVPIADLLSWGNPDHFGDARVTFNPNGSLSVAFNGKVFYTNFFIPNYQPISAGRLGLGARTGGLNENVWIDDLSFTTFLVPQTGISQQPRSLKTLLGNDATFDVQITNPGGATLQWLKNGAVIPQETNSIYVFANPALADSGLNFSVRVNAGAQILTSSNATLTVLEIPIQAPQLSFNFDDGVVPQGTSIAGTAFVASSGGVGDSGFVQLTIAEGDQEGYFVVSPTNSSPVFGFTVTFDAFIGGGSTPPADGFGIGFGSDFPENLAGLQPEEGIATGVNVSFDIFDNGGAEAPSVEVEVGGVILSSVKVPLSLLETETSYAHGIIRMEADGTLDVVYDGVVIIDNLQTPYTSITNGQFLFGARTGGSFENQGFDNIEISTTTVAGFLRITSQLAPVTALVGNPATFSVGVNNPAGATYKWFRNNSLITNATGSSYTLAPTTAADQGALFKVQVTGPNNSVTSQEVALQILNIPIPANLDLSLDFNSAVPVTVASVFGSAKVENFGGVGDSGVLILTENLNGQSGSFVMKPLASGAEADGFTMLFDVFVGGGTTPPADGWSVNFGKDLIDGTGGDVENGVGSGLTIGFDIYNNSGNEGPSIDVRFKGKLIKETKIPLARILTGDTFASVIIRMEADGTIDVVFKNEVIYHNLPVPGWVPLAGARFGFYARTGGLNAKQYVDNLRITLSKTAGPLRITQDPASQVVLIGSSATVSVLVSDPTGAAYQWSSNGVAIAGATSSTFTTAAVTVGNNGDRYSVRASGPGGIVNSADALITSFEGISVNNPQVDLKFEDGQFPAEMIAVESARIEEGSAGGNNSLVVKLTDDELSQGGAIAIPDFNGGTPVTGFAASFRILIGLNAGTPADGLSFSFSPNIDTATAWGQDGPGGDGLVLSFDTYDNGAAEAPAIDLTWNGSTLASRKLPISEVQTGDKFETVLMRVETDGTVDVIYKEKVLFYNIQIPVYRPLAGGYFSFGARTGGASEAHWVDDIRIATTTTVSLPPPQITAVGESGGMVTIQWTGGGTLQSSGNLADPFAWMTLNGANSGTATIPVLTSQQYFRVVR